MEKINFLMDIKMRRSDRALSLSESKEILIHGEYGILSTVSPDRQPYGIPLNYCYCRDAIYFHCALEGYKLENIQENSRVSFCVVGKTELFPETFSSTYESVIVFGNSLEITGDEKLFGLKELMIKYYNNDDDKGLQYINKSIEKLKCSKLL
jgi:nitroimidazol reductase NimA-like FMN-containing flavoprotein (pyridoxamine 5'-phosphate oxidase superfamily)